MRVAGFLGAEALSAIGSWATIVAIWGYAAYEYDASAGDVSLFGVAFALPGVVLGPVTGTIIDRLGPKVTLVIAKVVGVAASLALLRRTVACTFAVHLLYGMALLSEPLYVRDVLDRSEEVFAALQTVFGICLVAGGLLAARLGERLASFGWVTFGVAASGLAAIVYLGTPWVLVAFVGVALWGVATAVISGPSRTVLQRGSPQRAHGRVLSADYVAGSSAELVGIGIAGVLVGALGVQWSILWVGAAVSGAAAWLTLADRRDRGVMPAWPPVLDADPMPATEPG